MPSGVADFGAATWAQALFGVIDRPTTYWIALLLADPGPGADGDLVATLEPDDGLNYSRQSYGTGPSKWGINGTFLANLDEVDWGVAFQDWGPISHYALLDSPSGGNLYAWAPFSSPQYVTAGFAMAVPTGGLIFELGTADNPIVY